MELALSPEAAAECIRTRSGYVVDERQGCWIADARAPSGYGPFLAFYVASFGEVPAGLEVVHTCAGGPRGCVRPSHLDIVPEGARIAQVPDPKITTAEKESFAVRIRDERAARRASRPQFAAELGVAVSTLRDWEESRTTPTPTTHDSIAHKLGWDGLERRYEVLVLVERIVAAQSAGAAARQVIDALIADGQPEKAEIIRARVRP